MKPLKSITVDFYKYQTSQIQTALCLWLYMTGELAQKKHITLTVLQLQNKEIGQMTTRCINISACIHLGLSKL